jgi:hypothetical protein
VVTSQACGSKSARQRYAASMRVFLSWSGEKSRAVAEALKVWLPDVLRDVEPFMSGHDIEAGAAWEAELSKQLTASGCGILCLTKENLQAPWVLYEAGALSRSTSKFKVVPYRIGLTAAEILPPLSRFQGVDANEKGTRELVESLNLSLRKHVPSNRLADYFEIFWPRLKPIVSSNSEPAAAAPARSIDEYLKEILTLVRRQASARAPEESAENGIQAVIKALKKEHERLQSKIDSMREYERNGGGAASQPFWDPLVERNDEASKLLSDALALLDRASRINLNV